MDGFDSKPAKERLETLKKFESTIEDARQLRGILGKYLTKPNQDWSPPEKILQRVHGNMGIEMCVNDMALVRRQIEQLEQQLEREESVAKLRNQSARLAEAVKEVVNGLEVDSSAARGSESATLMLEGSKLRMFWLHVRRSRLGPDETCERRRRGWTFSRKAPV